MESVAELIKQVVAENANTDLDQTEYRKRYDNLSAKYQKVGSRIKEIESTCVERKAKRSGIDAFVSSLMAANKIITEFSETLWNTLVDRVTVYSKNDIRVTLRNGMEIMV